MAGDNVILINAKIDCLTVNHVEYTFVNMSENEIYGWKRLLQSLDGVGWKYEIHQISSGGEYQWCYLPNANITIHVIDKYKYRIEYYLKNGESCDWDIGSLKTLMSFINVYPNHPACE